MRAPIEANEDQPRKSFLNFSWLSQMLEWLAPFNFQGAEVDDYISNSKVAEHKPDNFQFDLESNISDVDQDSSSEFASSLFELTDEERAGLMASFEESKVPITDFFALSGDSVVNKIKIDLGNVDGPKLVRQLLAEGVRLEDMRLFDNQSGDFLDGVLIPKSSISDLPKFQSTLKELSRCGRLFPVTVEGEWLKIDFNAYSAYRFVQKS